jgi:polyhydroxyalkanoate synthesis repressor PhaR
MSGRNLRGGTPPGEAGEAEAKGQEVGAQPANPPVVVKKYANRRLYNTEASSYVTLDDLANMVRQGRDFVVYDAKSGEDITRSVLTQIIVEEEAKGRNLLPESFLRQLIGFYGHSLQALLPNYLENAMAGFARQQEQLRRSMEQLMPFHGGLSGSFPGPFGSLEELGKQNMAMMERAMSLFAPFRGENNNTGAAVPNSQNVEALKAELEAVKKQLAELRAKSSNG